MVPEKAQSLTKQGVTGGHTKKFTKCERWGFIIRVSPCSERGAKSIQMPLVKSCGRCDQYILLKTSYVTRSVRPCHPGFFFLGRKFPFREEPDAAFMSPSSRLDNCKYKRARHQHL